jgi:hypothetical protein
MPVTSAASWYCAEYRERDTKRKSECQYSNVVVGLRFRKHVAPSIFLHRSGVFLVYVDVQTADHATDPCKTLSTGYALKIRTPYIQRNRREEKFKILFHSLLSGTVVSEEWVLPDRYSALGLRIEIGPSSTTSGVVRGSFTDVPCDGTRSIKTDPFIGPSFLLRFPPKGVTSVSLDAGDIGPSDEDTITVTAFSDDALLTLIDVESATLKQDAPTGCVRLSVQAIRTETTLIPIKAVEITSVSHYNERPYLNSFFIDNVSFEPVR